MASAKKHTDYIDRGRYGFNVVGSLTMGLLSVASPVLQLAVVSRKLDLASVLPRYIGGILSPPHPAVMIGLGLTSIRTLPAYETLVVSLSAVRGLKHLFWVSYLAKEEVTPSLGAMVGSFNLAFDTINTMFSLWSITSPASALDSAGALARNPVVATGVALFAAGIAMEVVAEVQRKNFKDRPESKGRAYTGGLFGVVRHANYGGYTLWRTGAAMVSGGWAWGLAVGAWFFADFVTRGIPALDEYCSKRYGEQWTRYKADTKYQLIPWIY